MELNLDKLKRKRWIILYYLAIGGFCLIGFFRILPDVLTAFDMQSMLSENNLLIEQAESIDMHMDEYEQQRTNLGSQLENMVLSQDREAQLSTILDKISSVAKEAKVQIQRIKPHQVMRKTSHSELPIDIVVASDYHALGRFLNRLETGQPVIKVRSFEIRSESMLSYRLDTQINVTVLYLEQD